MSDVCRWCVSIRVAAFDMILVSTINQLNLVRYHSFDVLRLLLFVLKTFLSTHIEWIKFTCAPRSSIKVTSNLQCSVHTLHKFKCQDIQISYKLVHNPFNWLVFQRIFSAWIMRKTNGTSMWFSENCNVYFSRAMIYVELASSEYVGTLCNTWIKERRIMQKMYVDWNSLFSIFSPMLQFSASNLDKNSTILRFAQQKITWIWIEIVRNVQVKNQYAVRTMNWIWLFTLSTAHSDCFDSALCLSLSVHSLSLIINFNEYINRTFPPSTSLCFFCFALLWIDRNFMFEKFRHGT